VRDAAVWLTVVVAVALADPEVAVIVAVPSATAVTNPAAETVAMDEFDVTHTTVGFEMTVPPASLTVAVSWVVSPSAEKLSTVWDRSRLTGTWTVTAAVVLADPEVAVIVAVPSVIAVTNPADETVATEASDVAHVTVASLIVPPLWSFTEAESCCVWPSEEKLRLVAESVIEVATDGGGIGGGPVVLSPQAVSKRRHTILAGRIAKDTVVCSSHALVVAWSIPCLPVTNDSQLIKRITPTPIVGALSL